MVLSCESHRGVGFLIQVSVLGNGNGGGQFGDDAITDIGGGFSNGIAGSGVSFRSPSSVQGFAATHGGSDSAGSADVHSLRDGELIRRRLDDGGVPEF